MPMPDATDQQPAAPEMSMPDQPASVGNGPAASGMMTPQAPEGEIESAKLDAYHACRLLDRLISKIGRKSEYADAAFKARGILTEKFGEVEEDSSRWSDAEIKAMVIRLAGPGQAIPKQGQQQPPQQGGQPQQKSPGQGQPGQQ